MKKTRTNAIAQIQQAISSLANDFSAEQAVRYLHMAMNILNKKEALAVKKKTAAVKYAEEAKQKNDKWWAMIREGMKKDQNGMNLE